MSSQVIRYGLRPFFATHGLEHVLGAVLVWIHHAPECQPTVMVGSHSAACASFWCISGGGTRRNKGVAETLCTSFLSGSSAIGERRREKNAVPEIYTSAPVPFRLFCAVHLSTVLLGRRPHQATFLCQSGRLVAGDAARRDRPELVSLAANGRNALARIRTVFASFRRRRRR